MPTPPPDPLSKIESMLEIMGIVHFDIFDRRRALLELGHDPKATTELLGESARIVLSEGPEATREVRALAERWVEQDLLDPPSAPATRALLEIEIARAERRLGSLLSRQREIINELRSLADPGAPPGDS